jgi:hypothetical protein
MDSATANKWLVGFIIILWSIGVAILPAIEGSAIITYTLGTLAGTVTWIYLGLHVAIYLFALYLLVLHLRFFSRRKKPAHFWFQLLLYIFVLTTLTASLYLLIGTWGM